METFSPSLPLATGAPFEVPSSPLQQYTTEQILALSAAESAKVLVAYCSDCISSGSNTTTGRGDAVMWNGSFWNTLGDGTPPTTDFLTYVLYQGRFNNGLITTPSIASGGEVVGLSSLSGSAGAITQQIANNATIQNIDSTASWLSTNGYRAASCAVTAGSVGRGLVGNPYQARANEIPSWSAGIVVSHITTDTSPSANDSWHIRYGLETYNLTATAALQADMASLITDQQNILGLGASGANWRALVRGNSSTLDYVDTGVPIGNPAWMVITVEPVSGTTCRFRVATANNLGATVTTHVDRSTTNSSSQFQSVIALARGSAVAPTLRVSRRRYAKTVVMRFGTSSTTFVS